MSELPWVVEYESQNGGWRAIARCEWQDDGAHVLNALRSHDRRTGVTYRVRDTRLDVPKVEVPPVKKPSCCVCGDTQVKWTQWVEGDSFSKTYFCGDCHDGRGLKRTSSAIHPLPFVTPPAVIDAPVNAPPAPKPLDADAVRAIVREEYRENLDGAIRQGIRAFASEIDAAIRKAQDAGPADPTLVRELRNVMRKRL